MFDIRRATNRDALAVKNLIFDIWLNEYHFDIKEEDFPDLNNIEKHYGHLFWVASSDGEVVGTIAADQLSQNCFVLKRMFVKADYRRQGLAQRLLNELLSEFVGEKASFYLSTKESEALAAKAFYLKNGFGVISKDLLPRGFPFFYEDDLFMLKNLDL